VLKRFRRCEDGSLTLEAAMVMPFFLLFIVFMATIIRISIVDMALKKAASETAEVIAAHVYPAVLMKDSGETYIDSKIKNYTGDVLDLEQAKKIGNLVLSEFNIDITDILGSLAGSVLEKPAQNKFDASHHDGLAGKGKLKIEKVELPKSFGGGDAYIGIVVTYEMKIVAPFINKKIVLQKRAYERLWAGA